MLVTEQEAIGKICMVCPVQRTSLPVRPEDATKVFGACYGSTCMHWRWDDSERCAGLGFCGLAGKPH